MAAALLALFYLNSQTWSHGYLGFDMFLVITGYLLFSSRRAAVGVESLRDSFFFVVRRLQKIIPPTAIVIMLSLAVGAALLWWEDEWLLSRLGFSACLARANVLLGDGTQDFFAEETAFMPLLHLWYISALVQVYVLWCVGNQLLQKRTQGQIVGVLSVVALVSMGLYYSYPVHEWLAKGGVHLWEQNEPLSHFYVSTRLWEVIAGGLVTLLPSLKHRRWLATLAALAGVLLLFSSTLSGAVPGTAALGRLPVNIMTVVGTILTIRYLPTSELAGLFSYRPVLWLGRISFSLFLVSLPVIVYGKLLTFGEPALWVQVLLFGLMLLLAWGLRRGIDKRELSPEVTLGLWGGAFVLCGAGSLTEGFKDYVPAVTIHIPAHPWQLCRDDRLRAEWDPALDFSMDVFRFLNARGPKSNTHSAPLLTMGDPNRRPTMALIGDSHAAHHYAGFSHFCLKEELGGVYVASRFMPFHNWKANNNTAKEQALLHWLRRHPELTHVIIAQRWHAMQRDVAQLSGQPWATPARFEIDLRAFLQELAAMGKSVVLVGPGPEFNMRPLQHFCKALRFRGMTLADIAPVCTRESHMDTNRKVMETLRRLEKEKLCTVLDPMDALEEGRDFLAAAENTLLMYDQHRMYAEHSIYLIERLVPQLRNIFGIVSATPVVPSRKTTSPALRKP